jgi:enoyl-CoA hydratase/carnithine racemase
MSAETDQMVLDSLDGGVLTLSFNNPERFNAWTHDMEHRYFALLDEAAVNPKVKAIVVTGHGKNFCPGADTTRLATAQTPLVLEGRRSQHYPLSIPKPIIGAINGGCAGIGFIQALVCDVRFAARDARFSTAYARLGLPAEYGAAWILPRLIGIEKALDLLLSARRFGAEEAQALGVVSRVCEPDEVVAAAQAYAADLALHCSPRSMAAIRRQVWGDLSKGYLQANEDWLEAMRVYNIKAENPDLAEGVAAFREKRLPNFTDLPNPLEVPEPPRFASQ